MERSSNQKMNYQRKAKCAKLAVGIIFLASSIGCGVKGRPTPPDTPPTIGSGESLPVTQKMKKQKSVKKDKNTQNQNDPETAE